MKKIKNKKDKNKSSRIKLNKLKRETKKIKLAKSKLVYDKKNINAKIIRLAKLQLIIDKKEIELKTKNHLLRVSKRKLLKYIILVVALFSMIWGFSSLKAQSVSQKYSTFISEVKINEKAIEAMRANSAKEDLLAKESPLLEDFGSKIKNTDFEKMSFEKNIPVLMYHYIEPESPGQSTLRRDLGVTPKKFDEQMKWLYDNGFKTLTLSNYFSLIADQKEIPSKSVLITMDDGYRDFFENAAPVLLRYNMTATVFIIADSVGYPAYMDWDQIKLLSSQGFEFGSHSLNHPNLRNIKDEDLKDEMVESKKKIENQTGKSVNFFCYPTGAFDDRVEKATRDAGYRGAFTIINGYRVSNKNMFELPRFRITHTMSEDGFAWTVNSATQ